MNWEPLYRAIDQTSVQIAFVLFFSGIAAFVPRFFLLENQCGKWRRANLTDEQPYEEDLRERRFRRELADR